VRTFQIPREFKSLTVHENLLAAAANPQGERLINAFFQTRSGARTRPSWRPRPTASCSS
jgi:ABC-type branched-subunit amino acid transport system ATPase component